MSYQAIAVWLQAVNFMAQEKYAGNIEGFNRRARSLAKANKSIQAAQQRRSFVTSAREALAQTQAERLASQGEGAFESSATQGMVAGINTQMGVVLNETRQMNLNNVRIERLNDRARRHAQDAAKIDKALGSASSAIGGMG